MMLLYIDNLLFTRYDVMGKLFQVYWFNRLKNNEAKVQVHYNYVHLSYNMVVYKK